MAKNGKQDKAADRIESAPEPDLDVRDVEGALERARLAADEVKPRDAALYWTLRAQTGVLLELRDELRRARGTQRDAPPRSRRRAFRWRHGEGRPAA